MAKKLAKRNKPAPAAPVKETADEQACEGAAPVVAAPDPEPEPDDRHHKRNPLPAEKISHTCACGTVSTVYVADAEAYDEKARILLFKKRGSCYKPAMCRWCVSKLSREKQKLIA